MRILNVVDRVVVGLFAGEFDIDRGRSLVRIEKEVEPCRIATDLVYQVLFQLNDVSFALTANDSFAVAD